MAALFAIHPLHVESVAWIAERKDLLSGLFFMLTLGAYADYARRPFSPLRYLLVTVLFILGLMAKSMLVTLPFVLLLLDYWPLAVGPFCRNGQKRIDSQEGPDRLSDTNREGPARQAGLRWYASEYYWKSCRGMKALAAISRMVTYWAQGTAVMTIRAKRGDRHEDSLGCGLLCRIPGPVCLSSEFGSVSIRCPARRRKSQKYFFCLAMLVGITIVRRNAHARNGPMCS